MDANKGSDPSSQGSQALCMDTFPVEGKRQCYPSCLSKTCLNLSFFQLLCIILGSPAWPEQVSLLDATLSIFSFTRFSCQANAKLRHNLLSWSPNKLFLAPQIVFQVWYEASLHPIKPIVPGWPFLFREISSTEIITSADSEEKLYEAPEDFHANEFQSIISSSLPEFHLSVHKISDFYRKISFISCHPGRTR